jgi:hypothetical protein
MLNLDQLATAATLAGFVIGLPTIAATYYQSWRARREATDLRDGLMYSEHCLEFVLEDGEVVNLVPLATLHSLPAPGDLVLLPGAAIAEQDALLYGAYRIVRLEHLYTRVDTARALPRQARLAKAVAYVEAVTSPSVLLS